MTCRETHPNPRHAWLPGVIPTGGQHDHNHDSAAELLQRMRQSSHVADDATLRIDTPTDGVGAVSLRSSPHQTPVTRCKKLKGFMWPSHRKSLTRSTEQPLTLSSKTDEATSSFGRS